MQHTTRHQKDTGLHFLVLQRDILFLRGWQVRSQAAASATEGVHIVHPGLQASQLGIKVSNQSLRAYWKVFVNY